MLAKHIRLFQNAILTMLIFAATDCSAAETYLLRFKFEPDEQLKYRSSQTITQTAASPLGTKLDVSTTDQVRVFTVGEVQQDGTAQVSMQFEHVRMKIQSNGNKPIVFDSSMSAEEVPSIFRSTANSLKGAAARYELCPTGTPVAADGSQNVSAEGQASFMLPLPTEEVAVNDSWKIEIPVKVRIAEGVKREVRLLRTYRLKSVEEGVATISFSTSIPNAVKNTSVIAQLIQATPSGTITFDINKGLVTRRVLKVNRTVVGALGAAKSVLTATGLTEEEFVPQDAKVTAR